MNTDVANRFPACLRHNHINILELQRRDVIDARTRTAIYIYIYIERERDIERERCIHIYIYIHTHLHPFVVIHIHIDIAYIYSVSFLSEVATQWNSSACRFSYTCRYPQRQARLPAAEYRGRIQSHAKPKQSALKPR